MSQFSAEIRRSFQWWKFYKEESKRKSWFNLGLKRTWDVRTPSSHAQVKLTQKQVSHELPLVYHRQWPRRKVDFVLDELEGYATLRDDSWWAIISQIKRFGGSSSSVKLPVLTASGSLIRSWIPGDGINWKTPFPPWGLLEQQLAMMSPSILLIICYTASSITRLWYPTSMGRFTVPYLLHLLQTFTQYRPILCSFLLMFMYLPMPPQPNFYLISTIFTQLNTSQPTHSWNIY